MANVHPLINNMTGGVIIDDLAVRSDWDNYKKSLAALWNFRIKPYGGIYRRYGSHWLGKFKYPDKKVRLIEFVRANYDTYILEFGHLYMRVWRDYAQVLTGGVPYEIATPYTEADVDKLYWVQSNDVMWLCDGVHKPQKLTRTAPGGVLTFAIASFAPTADPFTGTDFPSVVTIFNERLLFANTPAFPQKLWFSKTGDFEDFTSTAGEDTSALTLNMSTSEVCAIRWLAPYQDKLYIGTHSTVHTLDITDNSPNLTVKNFRFSQQQAFGCKPVRGRQIGQSLMFVKRDGRGMIELLYDQATGSISAMNRNLTSPKVVAGKIKEFAWQQNPYSTLWCVNEDGSMAALTFIREHNVFAWHPHTLGANEDGAFVENVAILPSRTEDVDDVYLTVKRKVNGEWIRFLEVIKGVADDDAVQPNSWNFLDCNTYHSFATPQTEVTGLDHLEGQTVQGYADGYVVDGSALVVTGGKVTLPRAASVVRIGFNYTSWGETLGVDAGAQLGSAQGMYKRVSAIRLFVKNSLGGKYGYSLDKMDPIFEYKDGSFFGVAPEPKTGVVEKPFPGTWDRTGKIIFMQDQPLPMNIQAIGMDLQTNG